MYPTLSFRTGLEPGEASAVVTQPAESRFLPFDFAQGRNDNDWLLCEANGYYARNDRE